VGLGTPKQDLEARRLAASLPVVAVAIGAAFDLTAGSARKAPPWMTKIGLEWLHRLICEPRRLWKRYLFGNARFLRAALFAPKSATDSQGRARVGSR
jgi:N-acetylglucosaminyldiphosphoundecaprenol N-acetyl-beta-D-mannosaminyltransferase